MHDTIGANSPSHYCYSKFLTVNIDFFLDRGLCVSTAYGFEIHQTFLPTALMFATVCLEMWIAYARRPIACF